MFTWNCRAFCMIQQILAIFSLVPLPFLNPAWTSGSSQFMYCGSLAWRILSITLLACEMSAIVWQLEHSWHCLSLGLEWKLTFSSPVTTAEFSKSAGTLSAALSQHHLLGFEIAQLEFHHFQLALFVVRLLMAHSSLHSRLCGSRWAVTPHGYLCHDDLFCTVLLYILATS